MVISMPRFAALPAPRLVRWAGVLATLAMLALLAWVGAIVFWSLNTPAAVAPIAAIETDPARAAQAIVGRHPFGESPKPGATVVKAAVVTDIALRGVVAPTRPGRAGVAVLAIAGKPPVAVREGDEVAPGVKLARVLPTSVELERGTHVQSLSLPERGKSAQAAPPARREAR